MICFSLSGQNNYLYEIGSSQILEQSDFSEFNWMKSFILKNGNSINLAGVNLDNNTANSPCQCEEYQFGQVFWIFEMDENNSIVNQKCYKKNDMESLFWIYTDDTKKNYYDARSVWDSNSCVPNVYDIFYLNDKLTFHFVNGAEGGSLYKNNRAGSSSVIVSFNTETFNFENTRIVRVQEGWNHSSGFKIIDKIFEINNKLGCFVHLIDDSDIYDLYREGFQSFRLQEYNGDLIETNFNEIFNGNSDEKILKYKQDSPSSITLLVASNSTDGLYSSGVRYETSLYIIKIDFTDVSNLQFDVTKSNLSIPYNNSLSYYDYRVFVDNNNLFAFKLKCKNIDSAEENKLHFLNNDGTYNSIDLDMDYQVIDSKYPGTSYEYTYYINYDLYINPRNSIDTYGRKIKDIYFDEGYFLTLEEVSIRAQQQIGDRAWDVIKLFDYQGNVLSRVFFTPFTSEHFEYFTSFENIDSFITQHPNTTEYFYGINKLGGNYLIDNFHNLVQSASPSEKCGGSHKLIKFNFENTLSLDNYKNEKIKIYPNPTSEKLFLNSSEDSNLKIYNSLGQLIFKINSSNIIDVSHLKSGVYFVKIFDGAEIFSKKFIIN
jgi:hypothetical protein